ncbi:3'-5' exoribonuclease YhaM family protein [Alienimonas chondri]|uniref:3'-5' exoribonuclease YhaM n=1 Tax=Alienimonas chondri TaxID=2681879 RepID=A0ABX1V7X6_9PLAN|nr:OB-fold nucleic acid binding domain-containing protein [Alienimonas chondri]NNJ24037.1 3'-5' exoribonuclease YhaM [Alienimonas chondri]
MIDEKTPEARTPVDALRDGATIDQPFLLAEKSLRTNRNGQLYLLAQLRDRSGQISALMWNVSESDFDAIPAGSGVRVKGRVQTHQGGLQVIAHKLKPAGDDFDADAFRPAASESTDRAFAALSDILNSLPDEDLRDLMATFLADESLMEAFRTVPAGIKAHHAHRGGLCEHTAAMALAWTRLADLYPDVDSSTVLAGCFLHDLGKTRELDPETFTYTTEGQLLGHMQIVCDLLAEKIAATVARTGRPFPDAQRWHLTHLILSHHGTPEKGSVKEPMSPEAVALHAIDTLDAKVNEFLKILSEDPNTDSELTPYHPRLGRRLFRGPKHDA